MRFADYGRRRTRGGIWVGRQRPQTHALGRARGHNRRGRDSPSDPAKKVVVNHCVAYRYVSIRNTGGFAARSTPGLSCSSARGARTSPRPRHSSDAKGDQSTRGDDVADHTSLLPCLASFQRPRSTPRHASVTAAVHDQPARQLLLPALTPREWHIRVGVLCATPDELLVLRQHRLDELVQHVLGGLTDKCG